MKDTIMMIRERKGFSLHQATITIREDRDGSRIFSITGPKGCSIELPWEDVLEAGMDFVNRTASKCVECRGGYCEEECLTDEK